MTEELMKEQLSRTFVEAIARRNGYIIGRGEIDVGVDLFIQEIDYDIVNGRKMYFTEGKGIDIQLKCTTTKNAFVQDGFVKYDLEVKNYNSIIRRFNARRVNDKVKPLILILFVLPKDSSKWLIVTKKQLKLRKKAYWYCIDDIQPISTNSRTVRIKIPVKNQMDLTTFPTLFDEFYSNKTLQDD